MDFTGPKSRRSNFTSSDKLEDNYSEVGYAWTRTRGYELFLYHYVKRNHKAPICHPWEMILGKLNVFNVFVNVKLLKVIISNYNANDKSIYNNMGQKFMEISIDLLIKVFKLIDGLTNKLSFIELKKE